MITFNEEILNDEDRTFSLNYNKQQIGIRKEYWCSWYIINVKTHHVLMHGQTNQLENIICFEKYGNNEIDKNVFITHGYYNNYSII